MTVIDKLRQLAYRSLTEDEERALICEARAGDKHAMLQLIRNYLPAIQRAAQRRYHPGRRTPGIRWDDLLAAAIASAIEAVHSMDLTQSRRLAGPLSYVLQRDLSDAELDVAFPARVPHSAAWRYHRARANAAGTDDDVTWETDGRAAAPSVGLSEHRYGAVDALYRAQPLTAYSGEVEDASGAAPYIRVETLEDAGAALDALDPQARTVIEMLYGIGGEPLSHRKVGEALGMSHSSVGRIEARALRIMREALGA